MKAFREILSQTFRQWQEDGAFTLAAALAFTTVTSMAPLVIMSISVASIFYGEQALRGELVAQVKTMMGEPGAEVIQGILANATRHGSGIAASWSLAVLLLAASAVFAQLQAALNAVWNVAPKPDLPWSHTLKTRLTSMLLVLAIGVFLIGMTLAGAALSVASRFLLALGPTMQWVLEAGNFLLGIALFALVFGALFKVLPDAVILWRQVWVGAVVTSVLFNLGRVTIGLYLSKAAPGSAYGAAGSLIVLLLWTYYSALILLLGAEFTQVYALRVGPRIRPAAHAFRTSTVALPVDEEGTPILCAEDKERIKSRYGL